MCARKLQWHLRGHTSDQEYEGAFQIAPLMKQVLQGIEVRGQRTEGQTTGQRTPV